MGWEYTQKFLRLQDHKLAKKLWLCCGRGLALGCALFRCPTRAHEGLSCHTLPCSSSTTLVACCRPGDQGTALPGRIAPPVLQVGSLSDRETSQEAPELGTGRGSFLSLALLGVPHLVTSPHASPSQGQTEVSQRICGAQRPLGSGPAPWRCLHKRTYRNHCSPPMNLRGDPWEGKHAQIRNLPGTPENFKEAKAEPFVC